MVRDPHKPATFENPVKQRGHGPLGRSDPIQPSMPARNVAEERSQCPL